MVRQYIKKRKKDNFREFCQSINFNTNVTYIWNKCKIFKNKWARKKFNGDNSTDRFTKIANAIHKISPPCVSCKPYTVLHNTNDSNSFLDFWFNFRKFNLALDSYNFKASPGPNKLEYLYIVKIPLKVKLVFLDLLNEIYVYSKFPFM